jgi:hypothetical protein
MRDRGHIRQESTTYNDIIRLTISGPCKKTVHIRFHGKNPIWELSSIESPDIMMEVSTKLSRDDYVGKQMRALIKKMTFPTWKTS